MFFFRSLMPAADVVGLATLPRPTVLGAHACASGLGMAPSTWRPSTRDSQPDAIHRSRCNGPLLFCQRGFEGLHRASLSSGGWSVRGKEASDEQRIGGDAGGGWVFRIAEVGFIGEGVCKDICRVDDATYDVAMECCCRVDDATYNDVTQSATAENPSSRTALTFQMGWVSPTTLINCASVASAPAKSHLLST